MTGETEELPRNPSGDGEGSHSADDAAINDNLQSPAGTRSAPPSTRAADAENRNSASSMGPPMSESAVSSSLELLGPLGVERDGLGVKGYLSMRDEGVTYHRMKRFYCRCVGVNFSRFASRDAASAVIAALFSAEVQKVEAWDGKGLWHTYRHSFKLSFTSGVVFNVDADSEEDKRQWIEYIETALKGTEAAVEKWSAHASVSPNIMELTPGGLAFAEKKCSPPKFKNDTTCCHPGCHRFVLWLGMLLQRLSISQTEEDGVRKPALSKGDEDEVEALFAIFGDDAFGISDVIQVLHLHRHGCDEAYAYAVNKLLELSASNLADFEFFLPQIFHMWLTVDWTNNNIKAGLLFRVIGYATQLHIRLATAIYWLTRAAIDDSCGWGFGQSELYVPDFLYRKMSMCKLLMINVEMQISHGDWSFETDKDLPASMEQTAIIKCLFDRLLILVHTNTSATIPLGAICDAVSGCSIPQEFLLPSDALLDDSHRDNGEERRIFTTQIQFIEELCAMTERLRFCAPHEQKKVDIAGLADAVDANLTGATTESAPNSSSKASRPLQEYLTGSSDDRRSIASNVQGGSFLLKFDPDVAVAAMNSVEQAMQQYVLPQEGVANAAQLSEDLHVLREQLSIVYEYVIAKRKRLHVAVESAFGESFEEKRERLREMSSHVVASEAKDWDCVAFIVKSNDDLRQEVLCQQIIRQLQDIFQSADLPLRLLPYEIIATSASTGMIEYVKNAVSLDALKKRDNYTTLADHFLKTYGQADSAAYKTAMTNFSDYFKAYVIFLIQGFLALQQHADTILMMIAIMAQESSCPCFLSQNPRDILSATKQLFRLDYNQSQVIKHVISLVRRSHNSYRTRQYDVFQRMTNGILP
ncbi:hypothetical protein JG687_00010228 [Phytophthora cactorum]|uniref:PH domain-containing protein n=1 Tax=Phytophthora cactorum TaxID=29920 RepID=A0A8T1U7W0_9STRA|nr:hypothetical protein JG687_00010228 [Phytophthora cactorum]